MSVNKQPSNFDYLFKVYLTGDYTVGKTALFQRFTDDSFSSSYGTMIGLEFKYTFKECEGRTIKFMIVIITQWDISGSDRFRQPTSSMYRGAKGLIVAYDCTNEHSFQNASKWIENGLSFLMEDAIIALVATKCDLVSTKSVSTEEGAALAQKYNLSFFETSSKEDINVTETFNYLALEYVKKCRHAAENFTCSR